MSPGAMSMIIIGTKSGLRARWPRSAKPTTWSWKSCIPPMPDPKTTPVRLRSASGSVAVSSPASASASSAATTAYCTKGS